MYRLFRAIFLLLVGGSLSFSQTFSVSFTDTVVSGSTESELVAEAVISNLSDQQIGIKIVRTVNDLPENWTSSLCLTTCLLPFLSTIEDSIAANDSQEFSLHFYTDSLPGEGYVQLSFSIFDGSEEIVFGLNGSTLPTGIASHKSTFPVFRPYANYPNPFNGNTLIRLDLAAGAKESVFKLYNINGQLLREIKTTLQGRRRLLINFNGRDFLGRNLASGVYFYTIQVSTLQAKVFRTTDKLTIIR